MKKRVLIIDDEQNIRRMMRLALETSGYEVGEAANGEEGLAIFTDGSAWNAVLLDQRMPGLDGLETLRRIKEIDADARVVMATAYASIELAVDAMKIGSTDFVRTPMTPETLRAAVGAAISRRATSGVSDSDATAGHGEKFEQTAVPTLTLNGFEIVAQPSPHQSGEQRVTENQHRLTGNEHRFIVKTPDGQEQEVVVEIASAAVDYVERLTRRRLPPDNSFWALQAERLLGNYLWNQGRIPEGGKLTLSDLSADKVLMAERWTM